jgi:hypothetical protein
MHFASFFEPQFARSTWSHSQGAGQSITAAASLREGGRVKVSERASSQESPHPTGARRAGRCTDLMSPTLGRRRRGR